MDMQTVIDLRNETQELIEAYQGNTDLLEYVPTLIEALVILRELQSTHELMRQKLEKAMQLITDAKNRRNTSH